MQWRPSNREATWLDTGTNSWPKREQFECQKASGYNGLKNNEIIKIQVFIMTLITPTHPPKKPFLVFGGCYGTNTFFLKIAK